MSHITSTELAPWQAQGLTTALRVLGVDARWRVGGMQGWLEEAQASAALAADEVPS